MKVATRTQDVCSSSWKNMTKKKPLILNIS